MDRELVEKCLLTHQQKTASVDNFLKEHPQYEGLRGNLLKPILRAQVIKAYPIIKEAVIQEIKKKLYHPPIAFSKDIDVDSKVLITIMGQVRRYYQIVFDEATEGIE